MLFPVVPTDFPYKMIHTKSWKNHENVYSLYKTVRTLRGTKNTFETIKDNKEELYVIGALHVIKLAYSSIVVLL